MRQAYVIDGHKTVTLETFFAEFGINVLNSADWGRNLDALDDVLRGGFGTPRDGFLLRWVNSSSARASLGHSETVRQLRLRLIRCHPDNYEHVNKQLDAAISGEGTTVFDWLVDILEDHGPGRDEASDNVSLSLE